jgi:hypothetical protein
VRKGTTLFVVERRVLEQVEAEFLAVELESFSQALLGLKIRVHTESTEEGH